MQPLCLGQGQCAGILGKIVVGEDQIGGKIMKRLHIFPFVLDPFGGKVDPRLLQFELHQIVIACPIFQDEDSHRFLHDRIPCYRSAILFIRFLMLG